MIHIEAVEKIEHFLALREEWNNLLNRCPEHSIFLTHEWIKCWWQNFANKSHLFIVIARKSGKLVAIAPLMISKIFFRGLPSSVLSFIENGNTLHNDFILAPEYRPEVLSAIISYLLEQPVCWDLMELKNIPESSQNLIDLNKILSSADCTFIRKPGLVSPYLNITSDWGEYYKSRSRSTKKNINNVKNKIRKHGDAQIQLILGDKDFLQVQEDLYTIAQDSWSNNAGDSLASDQNKSFFNQLSQVAADNGWLRVWVLRLNNEAAAFEYHLQFYGVVYGLRSSYKERLQSISPGFYLDFNIIKNVFESKDIKEYDLGGSQDFYKKRWTNEARTHANVYIFPNRIYSHVLFKIEAICVPVLKKLYQNYAKKNH